MAQQAERPLETEDMSPSVVLGPWMAFVEQITSPAELQALGHAVEAVRAEMQVVGFDYAQAMWCLEHRWQGTVHELLQWQGMFTRDVQQACWHWQQAAMWLRAYGEQRKGSAYAVLYEHAHSQQQRVVERGEALWGCMVELCQQEGISVPGAVVSSATAATAGEGW
jgi:hypothetical protein